MNKPGDIVPDNGKLGCPLCGESKTRRIPVRIIGGNVSPSLVYECGFAGAIRPKGTKVITPCRRDNGEFDLEAPLCFFDEETGDML